jgi:hypothetical protein
MQASGRNEMALARVIEIVAGWDSSFEGVIKRGLAKAGESLGTSVVSQLEVALPDHRAPG